MRSMIRWAQRLRRSCLIWGRGHVLALSRVRCEAALRIGVGEVGRPKREGTASVYEALDARVREPYSRDAVQVALVARAGGGPRAAALSAAQPTLASVARVHLFLLASGASWPRT